MLANSSRRATWLSDLGLVGLGWSFWASQFLLPVPVLTYAYMLKTGRRRYAWLAWILGMAITLLFLPLGGRLRALTPLILVFIARHYLEDRVTVRQVILLSGVLIMFIFVAGVIRGQNLGSRVLSNPLMTLQDISYSLVRVLGLDFDRIEVLAFIMDWFPGRMPLLQGRTFVSTFMPILTKIIPNLSYNSFPSAGIFLGQIIYGRSDIPGGPLPTLLGEIYMNFGYWGSVFGFFLVGAILRLLYTVFKPSLGRDVGLSVLYSMLTFLLVFNSFFNNLALFKASIIILPTTLIVLEFGSRRFTSRRAKV